MASPSPLSVTPAWVTVAVAMTRTQRWPVQGSLTNTYRPDVGSVRDVLPGASPCHGESYTGARVAPSTTCQWTTGLPNWGKPVVRAWSVTLLGCSPSGESKPPVTDTCVGAGSTST